MKTALLWFTTDLRLRDNETLARAIARADQVIPVYCLSPADFSQSTFGFPKMGYFRARFLFEALHDLDQRLRAIGSGLIISMDPPELAIPAFAKIFRAQSVFVKEHVGFEEIQVQMQVRKSLHSVGLETVATSTLYHEEDLPYSVADLPDVFTQFRIKLEKYASVRSFIPAPARINSPVLPPLVLPDLSNFGIPTISLDPRRAFDFAGGERAAQARIGDYLFQSQAALTYKETRNGMIGANYSTKFSPYLALGCVSPRDIYWQIKSLEEHLGANESTYWIIFELLWRDYFWFLMKKRPMAYFLSHGILRSPVPRQKSDPRTLQAWVSGKTGQPFIDAHMRELAGTGFMSNRGRQNVASYFCHTLQQDWRYGAAYFESQLVDYDVSSNWGNWAYVAGVGNDPRPDRRFNIEKQAEVYDPNQLFQRLWLN